MLQGRNGALLFLGSRAGGSERDVISFSDFWSFGADDRQVAVTSAALRGDLEIFKDICDSDDCSVFIFSGVGVEDSNCTPCKYR